MDGRITENSAIQRDVVSKLIYIWSKRTDPRVQKFIEILNGRSV